MPDLPGELKLCIIVPCASIIIKQTGCIFNYYKPFWPQLSLLQATAPSQSQLLPAVKGPKKATGGIFYIAATFPCFIMI